MFCFTGTRPSRASSITCRLNSLLQDYTRSGFVVTRQLFFKFVCSSRTRGHSFKLFYQIQRLIVDSIFSRVLRIWNSLPEDVVSAAHLSLFISSLVRQFKSLTDRQDVGALMCSVFTYLDLHY